MEMASYTAEEEMFHDRACDHLGVQQVTDSMPVLQVVPFDVAVDPFVEVGKCLVIWRCMCHSAGGLLPY